MGLLPKERFSNRQSFGGSGQRAGEGQSPFRPRRATGPRRLSPVASVRAGAHGFETSPVFGETEIFRSLASSCIDVGRTSFALREGMAFQRWPIVPVRVGSNGSSR